MAQFAGLAVNVLENVAVSTILITVQTLHCSNTTILKNFTSSVLLISEPNSKKRAWHNSNN